MNYPFEPGFILFVHCDLDSLSFCKWFMAQVIETGIQSTGICSGRLGLNYIDADKNQGYDPDMLNKADGFLYYRHKIEVYRGDPLPEEPALITEQVDLCRALLSPILSQSWRYHIHGDVAKYL